MYGDLGIEEGNAEDGDDHDDHDDNGSASAMLEADDDDFSMEASGKPSTGIIIHHHMKLNVSVFSSVIPQCIHHWVLCDTVIHLNTYTSNYHRCYDTIPDNTEVRGLPDVPKSAPHTVTRRDYSSAPPNMLEDIPYAMQVHTSLVIFFMPLHRPLLITSYSHINTGHHVFICAEI